ncbi:MAG: hypothetical protein JWR03_3124 [Cohnella sp.]|nr:hypothetical protein [Cohnella sp.]
MLTCYRKAPVRFSPSTDYANRILLPVDRIRPIGSPYLTNPLRIPPSNWVISASSDPFFRSAAAIGQNLIAESFLMTFSQPLLSLIYLDARSVYLKVWIINSGSWRVRIGNTRNRRWWMGRRLVWKRPAQELRTRGHEVYTPTLTGLGERLHFRTADTVLHSIQDVVNVFTYEGLYDVVLRQSNQKPAERCYAFCWFFHRESLAVHPALAAFANSAVVNRGWFRIGTAKSVQTVFISSRFMGMMTGPPTNLSDGGRVHKVFLHFPHGSWISCPDKRFSPKFRQYSSLSLPVLESRYAPNADEQPIVWPSRRPCDYLHANRSYAREA